MINFAQPGLLVWLWLLPILAVAMWFGQRIRQQRLARFSASRMNELLVRPPSLGRAVLKSLTILLAVALVTIALAQPRFGFEWMELPQGGMEIMVVLDVSRSMESSDIQPTRLERAKREISDLLAMLEGDRIGIVGFAGVPFVHCPLTVDYRLAKTFISYISPDLMPVQGTAIGDAIRLATERLTESSEADSQAKAILLITDGEDHESDPLQAAAEAKAKGIKIFTIGIGGTDGAPIPEAGGGFKKDKSGNLVVSKMDEETLKKIALATDGTYARSVSGDLDLQSIYREGMRARISDAETGVSRQKIWFERFQWLAAVALILLVLEFFLADSKRQQRLGAILFLLLGVSAGLPATLRADEASEGVKAFKNKEFEKAAKSFLDAEIEQPHQPRHPYNRGLSQFEAGDFDGAIEGFSKSAEAADPGIAGNSWFNLGNALVAKGKLEEAVAAYQKVLEKNPKDQQARENLAWVAKQIEKQKQQQSSDDKKQDGSEQKPGPSENKEQEQSPDGSEQQPPRDGERDQGSKADEPQANKPEDGKADGAPSQPPEGDKGEDRQGTPKQSQGSEDDANRPRDLSREEAEALLDSLESEHTNALPKPQIDRSRRSSEKDW